MRTGEANVMDYDIIPILTEAITLEIEKAICKYFN